MFWTCFHLQGISGRFSQKRIYRSSSKPKHWYFSHSSYKYWHCKTLAWVPLFPVLVRLSENKILFRDVLSFSFSMESAEKSLREATCYGVDGLGSNSNGGDIFRTRPDRPWSPPNPPNNGYRVFSGGKAARAWRRTPTTSSANVKERVELYLYSSSGPLWPVLGWTLPLLYLYAYRSFKWRASRYERLSLSSWPPFVETFIVRRRYKAWGTKRVHKISIDYLKVYKS